MDAMILAAISLNLILVVSRMSVRLHRVCAMQEVPGDRRFPLSDMLFRERSHSDHNSGRRHAKGVEWMRADRSPARSILFPTRKFGGASRSPRLVIASLRWRAAISKRCRAVMQRAADGSAEALS
ncbi:MAG: hypothetical protein JF591_00605 [Lysobacter sp.]|nr:hypothetical protein [Lysobacter sp.]